MSESVKILVVDDEFDLAEIVSESFEEHFESSFVTSGTEALKLVDENKVDVIISDFHMPEMTGLELLKKINQGTRNILFYLSSGDITISEAEILALGGSGFFEKPYDIEEAVKRIKADIAKQD